MLVDKELLNRTAHGTGNPVNTKTNRCHKTEKQRHQRHHGIHSFHLSCHLIIIPTCGSCGWHQLDIDHLCNIRQYRNQNRQNHKQPRMTFHTAFYNCPRGIRNIKPQKVIKMVHIMHCGINLIRKWRKLLENTAVYRLIPRCGWKLVHNIGNIIGKILSRCSV